MAKPTINDVARLAGVSAITVSRVLRDPAKVSVELRTHVEAAIRSLGYVPDPNARALASSRCERVSAMSPRPWMQLASPSTFPTSR